MPMKLVYFDVRGVVEVARYMLHMGGAEYEDFRYPIDTTTFAKPVRLHAREPRGVLRARPSAALASPPCWAEGCATSPPLGEPYMQHMSRHGLRRFH